ncbi:MAG: hypothetical protein KDI45_09200 [Candidatus Accumulibacter sp.]|nr:hypothetical protein [Accumulibacter sp.]MCB1942918.1 hypothetical protein [Accumulibacter sp.]MCB1968481.1 hypothetical protein [Accumulibacter sp.]
MDFSDVIKALNQASAFELYRMRAAIDRVLAQPHWLDSIRSRLRVGQTISYFDPQANTACAAQIIELRRKHALVLESATQKRWLIAYAAINVDGADVEIREQPRQGLGRNEVAVGEVVGFIGRDQQQRSGRVLRLNDKTVTLQCDRQQWRVSYALLHRVVDAEALDGEVLGISLQTHEQ